MFKLSKVLVGLSLIVGLFYVNLANAEVLNMDNKDTKINIGSVIALYPKPVTVIGAMVNGKVNWRLVGHTGIIGHDRILVSMKNSNYTNIGVLQTNKLSINLVDRKMLQKVDYVGSVSGVNTDKSQVFNYNLGDFGTPIIKDAPIAMECNVIDNYKTDDFDNFICKIENTYADKENLNAEGKLDFEKIKPVLFSYTDYKYYATGEAIGNCLELDEKTSMIAKDSMTDTSIVRLSRIEVDPNYLEEYLSFAKEVGEISLRTESGVLSMYAMQEKKNPNIVTILETYSSEEAYKKHIATEHFLKYKRGTLHMVKNLELIDQNAINEKNVINNYMKN